MDQRSFDSPWRDERSMLRHLCEAGAGPDESAVPASSWAILDSLSLLQPV